jgi:multiple sugar transport system substrate-binding protein
MKALHGITWDHPRAYQPLEAFQDSHPEAPAVEWDRQPLAGFESHPISDLAERYDLIILDHPGLGTAVAENALQPLETVFDEHELDTWAKGSIGPTWHSYHYLGQQWALPIDASTQVSILRPDLIEQAPVTWAGVLALPRRVHFTLCLGGPHALLHLLAMCAATQPALFLPEDTAAAALEAMQQLWLRCDQSTSLLDPIGVHEALAAGTGLAYCPLAYGYAAYGRPTPSRSPLSWANAPSWGPRHRPGSVLGGTGLAVSRHSAADPRVAVWIRAFLAPNVQAVLVPAHGGQPADRGAWADPIADAGSNGYYSATIDTMLSAWTRPRAPGWIAFQDRASELVRDCVSTGSPPAHLIKELNRMAADELVGTGGAR